MKNCEENLGKLKSGQLRLRDIITDETWVYNGAIDSNRSNMRRYAEGASPTNGWTRSAWLQRCL